MSYNIGDGLINFYILRYRDMNYFPSLIWSKMVNLELTTYIVISLTSIFEKMEKIINLAQMMLFDLL